MADASKSTPAKKAAPTTREPTEAEIRENEQPNRDLVPDPDEQALMDQVPGASDVHRARAHLDAADENGPVDTTPPAYVYLDKGADKGSVTLADVAAIQGVQIAPDASVVVEVAEDEVPFVSAGMANDLEIYGHATDPMTGRKVVRNQ
jgi:hypothetical protein